MPCPVLPAPAFGGCLRVSLGLRFVCLHRGQPYRQAQDGPQDLSQKELGGFVGGILGSVLIWLILWATHFYKLSLPYALLCGVVVSILGVIGDLIESRIKRGVGVKDSGNLIPGHGGMLDRSDSLIFGCIAAQLLLMIGGVL